MINHFQNNIALLKRKDPELAESLLNMDLADHFVILKSTIGAPTMIFVDPSGQARFLHSPQDPVQEAGHLLKDTRFRSEDGTLLFGFGLGYLAKEIVKKKDPHHLLCVAEAIPEILKLALGAHDLSDVLTDEDIHFFVGERINKILDDFRPIQLKSISGNIQKFALPPMMALYDGFYDEIEKKFHDHVSSLRYSFYTFLKHKNFSLTNVFQNIPHIMHATPVNKLKGLLAGYPALLIAAGPSLSKAMETIRIHSKEYFIICVDTALKPLLENDIKPDLVVTCDPHPINYRKVAGLPAAKMASLPLLFRADAAPDVIKEFGGYKFILDSNTTISRWIVNTDRRVMAFPPHPTVSHMGFLAARFMQADPIILVGLDLSFPEGKDHADGCSAPWKVDFQKTSFKWFPNNNGGFVQTIDPFISMIRQLEIEIQKSHALCINVSKEGSLIQGTEWMTLEEALQQKEGICGVCTEKRNRKLLSNAIACNPTLLNARYKTAFVWMLKESKSLSAICRRLEGPAGEGTTSFSHDQEKSIPLERMIHEQKNAFNHRSFLNIISDYLPRYLLSFYKIPVKGVPEADAPSPTGLSEQLTIFFEELREVLPLIEKNCHEILDQMDEFVSR
jgi:hypothetical protein